MIVKETLLEICQIRGTIWDFSHTEMEDLILILILSNSLCIIGHYIKRLRCRPLTLGPVDRILRWSFWDISTIFTEVGIWLLATHGLYSPWNSPGQNTGVGSLSFLQGIFPIQESNPGLPPCRQILYLLSHQGSPIGNDIANKTAFVQADKHFQ